MSEEEEQKDAQDLNAGRAGGSSTPDRRGAEEDLPPSLKAIEAELAALSPRTDRLDRERLIFLAGQQSVTAGDIGRTKRRESWGWPAAFSAMTAVAATFLVMLLLRGETPTGIRVVEVPAERPGGDGRVPDGARPKAPQEDRRIEPLPDRQEPLPQPASGWGLLALIGLDWAQLYQRDPSGSETSYPYLLDRLLREGVDSWPAPSPVADVGPAPAPIPYRELLDSLLDNPAPKEPSPDRPLMQILLYPGANS